MNIGAPVVATDADSDVLTYTLTVNPGATFDIDWATGQMMTKEPLDHEGRDRQRFHLLPYVDGQSDGSRRAFG